jgi:hypothetical protein
MAGRLRRRKIEADEMIRLHDQEGLTWTEVAGLAGISVERVGFLRARHRQSPPTVIVGNTPITQLRDILSVRAYRTVLNIAPPGATVDWLRAAPNGTFLRALGCGKCTLDELRRKVG